MVCVGACGAQAVPTRYAWVGSWAGASQHAGRMRHNRLDNRMRSLMLPALLHIVCTVSWGGDRCGCGWSNAFGDGACASDGGGMWRGGRFLLRECCDRCGQRYGVDVPCAPDVTIPEAGVSFASGGVFPVAGFRILRLRVSSPGSTAGGRDWHPCSRATSICYKWRCGLSSLPTAFAGCDEG